MLTWSDVLWWALSAAFVLTCLVMLRAVVRPWIYDVMIVRMTETWYREFLNRVPRGSRVLVSPHTPLVAARL
jgi:hypothetical protein